MMTGAKNILYGWMATLMLGCCALFVVSCSSDDPEQEQKPEQGDLLQLVSCTRSDDASIASGTRLPLPMEIPRRLFLKGTLLSLLLIGPLVAGLRKMSVIIYMA